jgi:3-deoxy-D-manno-octulosonic-acid transferase
MANASLWLYRFLLTGALPAVAPFIWIKDRLTGKQRPTTAQRMVWEQLEVGEGGVWIQAVSVGEVEVARRLVAELGQQASDLPVLLTSTTATGLALARRTLGDRFSLLPCPFDLPGPVKRLLDTAQPQALVLVETELWPELLYQAGKRSIPVAVINARLSPGSYSRYRRVRRLLKPLLAPVSLVLARSEADAGFFAELGIPEEKIRVSGNIKYDLQPDPMPLPWREQALAAAGERPIVVAGSTMEGEEEAVLAAIEHLDLDWSRLFLVLAPRHPERFDTVASMLDERGISYQRRSCIESGPADLLLLDTIGELGRAYSLASVAFIGGSMVPTGGHNPLEPAVWEVPVLTGPHVHNFQEVYDELLAEQGARIVVSAEELAAALDHWLADRAAAEAAGAAALRVVKQNRGATEQTVGALLELIAAASR